MKIEIVGSGGAFDKISSSYLINDQILIDCGESAITKLFEEEKLERIRHIFITHIHQDHVGGLEKFIYYKQIMANFGDIELTIHCNKDVKKYYKVLAVSKDSFNKGKYYEPFEFNILTEENKEFYFFGAENGALKKLFKIERFKVSHMKGTIPAFGYKINFEDERKGIIFTGDMDSTNKKIDKNVVEKNIIFHDMGWTDIPVEERKFHPTEEEVFEKYGETENIIGVHTEQKLKYYKKANAGDIYEF